MRTESAARAARQAEDDERLRMMSAGPRDEVAWQLRSMRRTAMLECAVARDAPDRDIRLRAMRRTAMSSERLRGVRAGPYEERGTEPRCNRDFTSPFFLRAASTQLCLAAPRTAHATMRASTRPAAARVTATAAAVISRAGATMTDVARSWRRDGRTMKADCLSMQRRRVPAMVPARWMSPAHGRGNGIRCDARARAPAPVERVARPTATRRTNLSVAHASATRRRVPRAGMHAAYRLPATASTNAAATTEEQPRTPVQRCPLSRTDLASDLAAKVTHPIADAYSRLLLPKKKDTPSGWR